MKKLLKLSTSLIMITILTSSMIYGHSERVHQYIVREAFKLLQMQIGRDIPRMAAYVGTTETNGYSSSSSRGSDDYSSGKIVCGAFREDVTDILWGYGNAVNPITQHWLASVTHFWDADFGDNFPTNFATFYTPGVPYSDIPNAYQKVLNYYSNNYLLFPGGLLVTDVYGNQLKLYAEDLSAVSFHYDNLIQLYKTGLIKTPSFALTISRNVKTGEEKVWLPGSNFYVESNYRSRIVFEILGRMIHLLGDMSVPAHVHTDEHRYSSDETYEGEYMHLDTDNDPYDNSNVNYWSAQKVWSDFGSIMSPYVSNDTPLHHLMYTLNQITDHFASFHYDGDDTKVTNNSELNQYFPSGVAPSSSGTYSNPYYPYTKTILHENIRNATFPHAIRATAGLLYWFAKEAELLPIPITGVNIIGTETLYQGATGVWGATAQNGLEPFTYTWEIKYVDGGGYLQSFASVKAEKEKKEKDKKKDGGIIINLAPSNEWVPLGLNSDVLTRPHNPTDLRDYFLKCSVTDASGTTKTSNEWFVDVTTDLPPVNPPLTKTVTDDNLKSEMNALSKENEIAETPKAYSLEQNYPNPFNPTTRISYSIKEAGLVTLKVFDILGREVSTLVNEVKPAGRFEVEFNASELPSGTYIYRLTAGNYQTINKMSFVK